jgi:hypothetical protein
MLDRSCAFWDELGAMLRIKPENVVQVKVNDWLSR